MKKTALEPATIKALQPGDYADGGGLYLIVRDRGTRSWLFKYQWPVTDENGVTRNKTMKIGLGSLGKVSLKKARELAGISRDNVRAGRDPKVYRPQLDVEAVKLSLRSSPVFVSFAKQAVTGYIANQKPRSQAKRWRSINHHCKALHNTQVGALPPSSNRLWRPPSRRCPLASAGSTKSSSTATASNSTSPTTTSRSSPVAARTGRRGSRRSPPDIRIRIRIRPR
jgi:Arm domain-containing DNA-binding protein